MDCVWECTQAPRAGGLDLGSDPLQARLGWPFAFPRRGDVDALQVAERRKQAAYPELTRGGPQTLLVLGSEIGGRWSTGARRFVRDLVRLRAQRAPPAVRGAAASAWARRWWSALSVAVQLAVASTALGRPWTASWTVVRTQGPALRP